MRCGRSAVLRARSPDARRAGLPDTGAMDEDAQGYRHIVVALDGGNESWAALHEAVRIARSSQARLDLLVAIPDGAPAGAREASEDVARRAASRAGDLPVMRYVVEGDPATAIVDHADTLRCDLIVMGCRSRIAPSEKLGESVTTAVSQRARVPVLVVRHIGDDEGLTRS